MFKAEFVGLVSNLIRSQQPYFGKSEKKVQLCASSDAAGELLCGRGLQPANQRRPRRSPARGRRRLRARLQGRAAGGRPRACGRARRRRRQIRLLPSGASRRLGRPSAGWVDGGRGLPVRLHGAGWLKLVGSKTFGTVCRVLGVPHFVNDLEQCQPARQSAFAFASPPITETSARRAAKPCRLPPPQAPRRPLTRAAGQPALAAAGPPGAPAPRAPPLAPESCGTDAARPLRLTASPRASVARAGRCES